MDSVVDSDRPCIRCGYSLRGLHPAMLCPECGLLVERSLKGELLQYCDAGYLELLARGVRWVGWSMAALVLGVIALVVVGVALSPTIGFWLDFVINLYGGLCATAFTLGWWWLTERDNGLPDEDPGDRARRLARAGVVVFVAGVWIVLVLRWIGSTVPIVFTKVVGVPTVLVFGASQVLGMGYFQRLGARAQDADMIKKARRAGHWFAIVTLAWFAVWIAERAIPAPPTGRGWWCYGSVVNLCGLIALFSFGEMVFVVRDVVEKARRAQEIMATATEYEP